jgi:tRNA (mo5U34)-methyltransferase
VNPEETRQRIIELGPWHHDVEVKPGLSTAVYREAGSDYPELPEDMPLVDSSWWPRLADRIYPDGLAGRSVLDCACNCGSYLFHSKEMGAGRCFGFDARELWIRQARFLLEHREGPGDNVAFEVLNLYDLPQKGLEPFDVTLFCGILYHLPDPFSGLRIAADLTNELIVVNTATVSGQERDSLVMHPEDVEDPLCGTHGLHWLPSGPNVVEQMLRWTGFVETHLIWWHDEAEWSPGMGRLQMVASKRPGLVDRLDPPADVVEIP